MENTPWGLGKGMAEASHGVFRNQTVALPRFAFATVGARRARGKFWLQCLVHTLVFEIMFVLKRMEPFQAEVQGIEVFWKAWHSWLEQKSGSRDQQYTEFSAPAWSVVIPWKLEHSLVLVSGWPWLHGSCWEELIPWIPRGAGHTGKWGYFGLPSAGSTCCIQHPK